MKSNPWAVPNVKEFSFLCCPECQFKSKEEQTFEGHAVSEHPKSHVLFNSTEKDTIKNEARDSDVDVKEFQVPELTIRESDPSVKVEKDEAFDDYYDKNDDDYDFFGDYDEAFDPSDHEINSEDDIDEKPEPQKRTVRKRKLEKENMEDSEPKVKREHPKECPYCKKVFKDSKKMFAHRRTHKKLQCDKCTEVLANHDAFKNHILRVHSRVTCEVCQTSCKDPGAYRLHFQLQHIGKSLVIISCAFREINNS